MTDNVQITAGSGVTIACDEVVDATLGTVKVQMIKVMSGTLDSTNKWVIDASGNGQMLLGSTQTWPAGMSPRAFSVAFATLTRPANQTPYTAGDSISDNATAGSVTALVSGAIADTNDDPLTLTEILISSTDTALAGKKLRAYLYNSDPTASSGVVGGDNAAFSNKKAGYIGSMSGTLESGFSDGTVGRLVPTYADSSATPAGSLVVAKPVSGAKTLYVQYQYDSQNSGTWTPSANSTTIVGTIKGFQGRAS